MVRKRGPWGVLLHSQTALGSARRLGPTQGQPSMKKIWKAALGQAFRDFLPMCADWNNRKSLQWGLAGGAGAKQDRQARYAAGLPSQSTLRDGHSSQGQGSAGSSC